MLFNAVSLIFFISISFGQEKINQKEPPPQKGSLGNVSWEMLEGPKSKERPTKADGRASYNKLPIHMKIEGLQASKPETREIPAARQRRIGEAHQQNTLDTVLVEGFEGTFPSGLWNVFDGDGATNGEYYWAKRNYRKNTGTYSAWCVGGGANGGSLSNGSNYPNNANSHMVYGPFDLSGTNWAGVTFSLWLNTESNLDYFSFSASVDGSNFYGSAFSGSTGGSWIPLSFSLKNIPTLGDITNRSSVWISFSFISDGSVQYEGVYLDDIILQRGMLDSLNVVSSFASPGSSPWGLTYDGTNLWNSDDNTEEVYKLSTTGSILSSFYTPGSSPGGMAWDGTNLWLAEDNSQSIYKLNTSGTTITSFTAPGPVPTGLAWDGTYLWVCDLMVNTIWKLTTTGQVVSSFSAPGALHSGLSWNGQSLWLVDPGAGLIYELSSTGTVLNSYLAPSGYPTDLEWDGTYCWLADSYSSRIYKLEGPLTGPNPRASFTISPSSGVIGTLFAFDASGSRDVQTPTNQLEVRWDWENDGTYDTPWTTTKTATHQYASAANYTVKLEVKDTDGHTDSTTKSVTVTVPATTPWSDNFPSTTLDVTKWPYNNGPAVINTLGLSPPSSPYSLDLNGTDEVRSQAIDLAGKSGVILRYYYEMGGNGDPSESGNDLLVDYYSSTGNWVNLRQHLGGGSNTTSFVSEEVALPAGAFHSGFSIRFRTTGDIGFDDWFVDNVSITVPSPVSVSPTSFNVTVSPGDSINKTLTFSNQGTDTVNFSVGSTGGGGATGKKIALMDASTNGSWQDIQQKLQQLGYFSTIDHYSIYQSTPSLRTLEGYDAVLVWTGWNGFSDYVQMGNNLADYVDAGGGLVLASLAVGSSNSGWAPGGRFSSGVYYVIEPTGTSLATRTMGTIYDPSHPILKNVTSLRTNSDYAPTGGISAGSQRIVDWNDGKVLAATKIINGHRRVDLGLFPPSSDVYSGSWVSSTDGAELIANALLWVTGADAANWLGLSPTSGTVAPGASQNITVKLNARGLIDTVLHANINVNSNGVPPVLTIPVTLTVALGPNPIPNFTAVPSSLYLGDTLTVNASECTDDNTPLAQLEVRWDWENDGTYDTQWSTDKIATHQYFTPGTKTIKLQVKDTDSNTDSTTQSVIVNSRSPQTFNLVRPLDGDTVRTITPSFIWRTASDVDPGDTVRYNLYYSKTSAFSVRDTAKAGTDTTVTIFDSLEQLQTYYWKVEAIDRWGNKTMSAQTGRRFLVADVTPPKFTIGILQNSILTEDVDLYAIPNETLDADGAHAVANGTPIAMTLLDPSYRIYAGDYRLSASGILEIIASGKDAIWENEGKDTLSIQVQQIKVDDGGMITSGDARLKVSFPGHAIDRDAYVTILPGEEFKNYGHGLSKINAKEPDEVILPIGRSYQVGPARLPLTTSVTLLFSYSDEEMGGRAKEKLEVARKEGSQWISLGGEVDERTNFIVARLNQLGEYRLQWNPGRVESTKKIPTDYALMQNYPNPFNPSTTIGYALPQGYQGRVVLTVYNVTGQQVKRLVDKLEGPGYYSILWDGTDDFGRGVASGVYLYRLQTDKFVAVNKMLFLR